MPGLTVKVPALHKQKSKLRLRLGLGAPEPTTTYTTITTSTASPKLAPITNSIGEARTRALDTSTSTSTTTNTRADTWSAFDLDISPSIDSASQYHPGYGAAGSFDTVSYRSVSPDSLATEAAQLAKVYAHNERTAQPESPRRDHNPTPSLSPENTLPRPRHLPDIRRKRLIEPDEESLRLPWTEKEFDNLAAGTEDTFSLTDAQLNSRFNFVKEVGFGNWGSVWYCRLRRMTAASFLRSQTQGGGDSGAFAVFRLGKIAQAGGEGGAGGAVAAKLINRVNDEVSAVRVQSLWNEMKVIRALRHEPHPSIIQFESFIITPSYALIIMPFHSRMIPVNIDPDYARPYFRQLASAVGYLHERGITHNDIKPANILLSHSNVPVLVDFGFAQRWNVDSERTFLSNICWGTPEYLDPQRFKGLPHDERASDVWALGVTMFEILVGRTPFESTRVLPNQDGDGLSSDSTDSVDEKSPIPTEEEYKEYHERTKTGLWYGKYNIPSDLEHLLRLMMSPDPEYRINAMQVYHHRALLLPEPQPVVTPQFVRAAATFEEATEHPVPAQKQKRVKKVKSRPATREGRASTPALGESIKQHTNTVEPSPSRAKGHSGESDGTPKKKAMVIRKSQDDLLQPIHAKHNDDTTPTKVLKPAQPLRVRDVPAKNIKRVMPRASASQISDLVGSSATSKGDRIHSKADHRVSAVSAVSSSGAPARDKEHAVLRTMRSLEGTRRIPDKPKKDVRDSKDRDVLGAIKRPAPSPPRPQSLDSSLQQDKKTNKAEQRRSLGADKHLAEVTEESPIKAVPAPVVDAQPKESTPKKQKSPAGKIHQRQPSIPSPPRVRMATRPTAVAAGITDRQLCSGPVESPMAELRERIMNMDKNQATELRQTATDLVSSSTDHALQLDAYIHSVDTEQLSSLTVAVTATETAGPSSQEPDAAMEKFKLWVQGVEKIVEDARKALAEGREPPMPPLSYPDFVKQPEQASSKTTAEKPQLEVTEHMPESSGSRGLSPEKSASLPVHLRTCSTQVEPATPPKWMTYEQAEERDKAAGEQEYLDRPQSGSVDAVVVRNVPKKERPTVSHVLKLFGNEKGPSRTVSPESVATVPLKSAHHGPTLRGAPSTPALRSATTVRQSSKPLARKSESNLRNFNTMPSHLSLVQGVAPTSSPRRLVYEDLLDSTPGVVRQGDGWSSNMYSGRGMSKPTSMASLRERAMAFLGNDHARENRDSVDLSVGKTHPVATRTGVRDRHIIDLASEVEKDKSGRNSRNDTLPVSGRPGTPSALSTLNAKGAPFDGKKQGLFGKLKGLVGRRGMDKVEEQ